MKKRCITTALALLTSLSATVTYAKEKDMTLMLDWFVNPNHGPIIIAEKNGYFKDQGLNVKIQEPADPTVPAKLVAAGSVDMAVSYQGALTIDVAAGLPLIRSATLISTPLNTLTVLEKSGIKTLQDFDGKKIGTTGGEDNTIKTMLKNAGVDVDTVQIVNVGWALSSSLASGQVDGIWGGMRNFETNQLELEGFKPHDFFPEEHGLPSYDELVFVANANKYDAETIKMFNASLELATQFIVNHPEKAWDVFVSYAPDTLDNELNRRAWLDTLTRFALRPSAVDLNRYDRFSEFMFEQGLIKVLPKAQDFVPTL
ncbi:ABC transporter ATP-binding protein [Vibrio sp. 10N.286.49.B3]|uniref:ABC transporter substrate-binding protein n=1 Tax=Vibrio sp. 10N.286.49.B3 TaxID=1880855 RepID=UPI000C822952|nr:ABC transporter substrate-binding protein [Vibrio sp. 10N.286.49.B3]PMH37137.1 ABC transporter ATP-binding protein [Vibrio sp. 10N.286.49.B3]